MASLLTFILSAVMLNAHPIHVSVADIELSRKDQELQIIVRIFTDDLEKEIRVEKGLPELDILEPVSGINSNDLFNEYLQEHFEITVNGEKRNFDFLGYEVESGAVISYILINDVSELKEIKVKNDILFSVFDDQVNLVHITIDDDISTLKFVRNEAVQSRAF